MVMVFFENRKTEKLWKPKTKAKNGCLKVEVSDWVSRSE
jgi:hypothetical protein